MIIGILVVVWIAVLAPIAVKHFRDSDADRSILSFHKRLARMGSDQPIVEPAYRLDAATDSRPPTDRVSAENARPRLRIVPDGATSADLDKDMSWDEWSRSMADEPVTAPAPERAISTRASAYSHMQRSPLAAPDPSFTFGSRSQRVRRRRILIGLGSSVTLSTLLFFVVSNVLVDVWALGSWLAFGTFLALMYYAMTTGLMKTPTVRVAGPVLARVGTRAPRHSAAFSGTHDDAFDEEYAQAL